MRNSSLISVFALLLALVGCSSDEDDESTSAEATSNGSASSDSAADESGTPADTWMTTSAGGAFLGSCDTQMQGEDIVLGQCRDWTGEPGPDLAVSCGGIGGVFSDTNMCPANGRVGTCTLEPVLGVAAIYSFYAPTSVMDATATCAGLEGTWADEAG